MRPASTPSTRGRVKDGTQDFGPAALDLPSADGTNTIDRNNPAAPSGRARRLGGSVPASSSGWAGHSPSELAAGHLFQVTEIKRILLRLGRWEKNPYLWWVMTNALGHLLGSKCRAAVLERLMTGWHGTMSELARRTAFSVRSVASEVRLLAREGVVQVEAVGSSDVVRLRESQLTEALRRLVQATQTEAAVEEDRGRVKESLVALGAPLSGVEPVQHFPADETLVRALRVARHDATVFRVLPLVLARAEAQLDWAALKEKARREKLKAELGVLASLTAKVAGQPSLAERVADLKDRRRTTMRYFPEVRSSFEKELARERTPPVAREWGFLMNVSEDALRSTLMKHGT